MDAKKLWVVMVLRRDTMTTNPMLSTHLFLTVTEQEAVTAAMSEAQSGKVGYGHTLVGADAVPDNAVRQAYFNL